MATGTGKTITSLLAAKGLKEPTTRSNNNYCSFSTSYRTMVKRC